MTRILEYVYLLQEATVLVTHLDTKSHIQIDFLWMEPEIMLLLMPFITSINS